MFSKITMSLLILLSFSAGAAVWEDTQRWDMDWEKKFGLWMNSQAVNKDLFVSSDSKYFGIKADCADASYALRAIFSLENGLPFRVLNPSGSRDGMYKYLSNRVSKFDAHETKEKRLVAFINYLGASVGTEQLSRHDTMPIKLENIASGMLFTYKIKGQHRRTIRHSYNITSVTQTGDFDVIYSTQAIAKEGLPMIVREGYEFTQAPHGAWGFRRFKWPQFEGRGNASYPAEMAYSQEQYKLIEELGRRKFFKHVKNLLKKSEETPQQFVKRKFNNLCIQSRDRIDYVNQGYQYHLNTNGKCMNYADYDTFSTPARDKALENSFRNFKADLQELLDNGREGEIEFATLEMAKGIAFGVEPGSQAEEDLYHLCSIDYRPGKRIHMAELFKRIRNKSLSSHPNDLLPQRWGETTRNRTTCKVWY